MTLDTGTIDTVRGTNAGALRPAANQFKALFPSSNVGIVCPRGMRRSPVPTQITSLTKAISDAWGGSPVGFRKPGRV